MKALAGSSITMAEESEVDEDIEFDMIICRHDGYAYHASYLR